ncbi:AAA family ATPase [Cytobacillus kochii]|uniref:ATP-dependent nuclease n=1 Tax=Cytobacillus kochii TaxID=859143 RepID=UPI001CD7B84E|nr:AAA family ATPase [Cytobacillus kochii]MCA1027793.1 AAA family ATPase [Cytobacillus kochii]
MVKLHSIYVNGYKCFIEGDFVGIEEIKPFNILIGRNNSGKSSLLDILSYATNKNTFNKNKKDFNEIVIGYKLTNKEIEACFDLNIGGGDIRGNHREFGMRFIGEIFHFKLTPKTDFSNRISVNGEFTKFKNGKFDVSHKAHWDKLANHIIGKITITVLRLGAERNIVPEEEDKQKDLLMNGEGATNIVNKFINLSTLDSKIVERDLLNYLNEIIYPDAIFTDIVVQQVEYEKDLYMWEIFLEEEHKGRISLSKSGSGLKTIILVLIQLLLLPILYKKDSKEIYYILEELENNLHPLLQRNLFNFIYEWAINHGTTIFLTTHSHIPINMFSGNPNTSLIHLRNVDNKIIPKTTLDYKDSNNILKDLDIKASDLLQSNGIIWVEGPTDRMYINKWLEVFGKGKFTEGNQYQIVYYGGKLLSHYSVTEADEENELINLLLANRNCAIVIDSDKRSQGSKINDTKKRIRKEFEEADSLVWITKGKEIENYIPQKVIHNYYNKEVKEDFTRYMNIKDYLDLIKKGEGTKYERSKVAFARGIIPLLNENDLNNHLDLSDKINALIKVIDSWNT